MGSCRPVNFLRRVQTYALKQPCAQHTSRVAARLGDRLGGRRVQSDSHLGLLPPAADPQPDAGQTRTRATTLGFRTVMCWQPSQVNLYAVVVFVIVLAVALVLLLLPSEHSFVLIAVLFRSVSACWCSERAQNRWPSHFDVRDGNWVAPSHYT